MSAPTLAPVGEIGPSGPPLPPGPAAPASLVVPALSSFLASAAFGWLAGSAFTGWLARGVGLSASAYGVAVVVLATRASRPALAQYVGAAAGVAVGAALVLPSVSPGHSVPGLVLDALRSGGLGLPPVAFDPGWRWVLFVLAALLGQTCCGLAVGVSRPRIAAAVSLPFVTGAALLQPSGHALGGTLAAILLLLGSLAVPQPEEAGEPLPWRRLVRGAGALLVLGGVLGVAAQVGFLFPHAARERVVGPMRPQLPPASPDRVLFTVTADRALTWRLGTLDVYRSPAWLTPPYDPARLVPLRGDGSVPLVSGAETRGPLPPGAPTTTMRVTLADLGGKALPSLVDPLRVTGRLAVAYDPRTQVLRRTAPGTGSGLSYQVTAPAPPTAAQLAAAGPPGGAARPFLAVPAPPPSIAALLASAPTNPFARLQFVRRAYFAKVVASGAGSPVDVSPDRVAELLAGRPGSPYEITAGEALLARWAGVPSRIGYGYYGGQPVPDRPGTVEIRPRNGATWLEAYFQGAGWVPIVGTPPRARLALDTHQQNGDPSVRASSELALVVYVPVRRTSVALLYVAARYYAVRLLPAGLLVVVAFALLAPTGRALRRVARGRAARRTGPAAELAAAYAEFRDLTTDLAIGRPGMTPVALLDVMAPDEEHRELAWLVTRGLWGDLARDLSADDVAAGRQLAESVASRLRRGQPAFTRLAAFVSRASLRDPWTHELPNPWPGRGHGGRLAAVAVLSGALVTGLTIAALPRHRAPAPGVALPQQVAPTRVGDVLLVPEPQAQRAYLHSALVQDGRVFSLHQGNVVQGSLQVAGFPAGIDTRSARVRQQLLFGLGAGLFQPARLGDERIYRLDRTEQVLLLSFAPDGRSYDLMVARGRFSQADQVFAAILAFRRGSPRRRSGGGSGGP